MGTDGQVLSDGKTDSKGQLAGIGDQLRQVACEDMVAVRFRQASCVAHLHQIIQSWCIQDPKYQVIAHKLRQVRNFHVQVCAHGVQCVEDHVLHKRGLRV